MVHRKITYCKSGGPRDPRLQVNNFRSIFHDSSDLFKTAWLHFNLSVRLLLAGQLLIRRRHQLALPSDKVADPTTFPGILEFCLLLYCPAAGCEVSSIHSLSMRVGGRYSIHGSKSGGFIGV